MAIYKRDWKKDETIDMKKTNSWLGLMLSSHIEGFIVAVQEQELDMKETRKRTISKERKKWTQNVEFVSNRKNQCTT